MKSCRDVSWIRASRRISALSAMVLLGSPFHFSGVLQAQTFKVLVLDAVSGKPQRNMQVSFFCQDSRRNYLPPDDDDTNSEGVVVVPYKCKTEDSKIAISVTGLPKEQMRKQ